LCAGGAVDDAEQKKGKLRAKHPDLLRGGKQKAKLRIRQEWQIQGGRMCPGEKRKEICSSTSGGKTTIPNCGLQADPRKRDSGRNLESFIIVWASSDKSRHKVRNLKWELMKNEWGDPAGKGKRQKRSGLESQKRNIKFFNRVGSQGIIRKVGGCASRTLHAAKEFKSGMDKVKERLRESMGGSVCAVRKM